MEQNTKKMTKIEQTTGAGTRVTPKITMKKRFSAKRLALMAVFVALSYVVSFLEIPLPLFGANFLKLDFGNVFIMLMGFALGPIEGVLVCFMKEGLRCLSSSSMCAGELANFLITSVYLVLPACFYQYKRNLKTVVITLAISCVTATGAALLANRFLIFPTYAYLFGGSIFGMTVTEAFGAFWAAVLIFNLIKTVAIGIFTMLLYKRLSNILKKMEI
ncbi:MAG: ECF transporter S component [Clostridia bacterium]|nr:ECF transporter S component [Clostridia bacterium]